jgi:recombination protein RecA
MKIGVMFGNPETTTGGNALKFYASVRLDIRRIQSIKADGQVIGNRTKVRVTKNKVAPPFREAEFDIMYNEGISRAGDVLDIATELEIITKRGAFFAFGDTRLGQGRENAKEFLNQNRELLAQIEEQIRASAVQPEAFILHGDSASEEDEPLDDEALTVEETAAGAVAKVAAETVAEAVAEAA